MFDIVNKDIRLITIMRFLVNRSKGGFLNEVFKRKYDGFS